MVSKATTEGQSQLQLRARTKKQLPGHLNQKRSRIPKDLCRKPKFYAVTCVVCGKLATGDEGELNAHVNSCLNGSSWTESNGGLEEYEWNGETRIRLSPASAYQIKNNVKEECHLSMEVNVVEDESCQFGPAQYSDANIVIPQHDSESDADDKCPVGKENVHGNIPKIESCPLPAPKHSLIEPSSNLVIDALKCHIKSLEESSKNVPKCLLCQEHYKNPCVSIGCWHVHCEQCWMLALGSKKTCPQCTVITRPAELRRIFL